MTSTPEAEGFPEDGQVEVGAERESAAQSPPGQVPEQVDPEDLLNPSPEILAAQVTELTGDLQRLQAEYVNYKRRVDRDRELTLQNAKYQVLASLLPILDDVDRARTHEELTGGFKSIAEALERVVAGAGLKRFGSAGDTFDPRLHEALMTRASSEVSVTTCESVVQAGYQFGERVVRPARVTVVEPDPDSGPDGDRDRGSDADRAGEPVGDPASDPGDDPDER